jgi:hypothetical protein
MIAPTSAPPAGSLVVRHRGHADEVVDVLERDDEVVHGAAVLLLHDALERLARGLDGGAQAVVGVDDDLVAALVELGGGRGLVDRRDAHERRGPVPLAGELEHLLGRVRLAVDEHHVGAGVRVRAAALHGLFHAPAGDQRLGAGDDVEVLVLARVEAGLDLAGVLLDRGQLALDAGVEGAALGEDVVLDADRGDALALVAAHHVDDVDRVAVPVVAVGDDRDLDGVDHPGGGPQLVGHREDVRVGHAVGRGDLEAAGPDGVEAGLLDQLGREAVVGAAHQDRPGPGHSFLEPLPAVHCVPPRIACGASI